MSKPTLKNLIIGGGFAGLYLASILDDAYLIEENPEVGGLIKHFKTERFTFDVGGHVYTTKDDKLSKILLESGAQFFPERKAYFDFSRRVEYPLQYNADKLGIKVEPDHPRDNYPSFGSLLMREFGHELYEKVFKPFNERVWSTSLAAMDTDWVTGRVALMKDKSKDWGPNSAFYYARGDSIINTMIERANRKGTQIHNGF